MRTQPLDALRFAQPGPARLSRPWLALLLKTVLGILLLLDSSFASAHVAQGTIGALDTPASISSDSHHGPSCHHGHISYSSPTLLRMERQDIEAEPLPAQGKALTTPAVPATTGTPRALPDPSPVPVYLVTRRLRS